MEGAGYYVMYVLKNININFLGFCVENGLKRSRDISKEVFLLLKGITEFS